MFMETIRHFIGFPFEWESAFEHTCHGNMFQAIRLISIQLLKLIDSGMYELHGQPDGHFGCLQVPPRLHTPMYNYCICPDGRYPFFICFFKPQLTRSLWPLHLLLGSYTTTTHDPSAVWLLTTLRSTDVEEEGRGARRWGTWASVVFLKELKKN